MNEGLGELRVSKTLFYNILVEKKKSGMGSMWEWEFMGFIGWKRGVHGIWNTLPNPIHGK